MSIFSPTVSISKSGILRGFTDFHCHILPGVDDGFSSVRDSLEALDAYEKAGITRVWLTPHIMEDIPNSTQSLRKRFEELRSEYRGTVDLHLASENMIDSLFRERLASGDFLPMSGDILLVETSYFNPPAGMYDTLEKVKELSYRPLLAHPERYMYMGPSDYDKLHGLGVMFQMNLTSLTGHYGDEVKAKAEYLLSNGYYSFVGTDLHRLSTFSNLLDSKLRKSVISALNSNVL